MTCFRRELAGQQVPRNAATKDIEDRIHDLPHLPFQRAAAL